MAKVKCSNCKGTGQLWPESTQNKQKQHWLAYECQECRGKGWRIKRGPNKKKPV